MKSLIERHLTHIESSLRYLWMQENPGYFANRQVHFTAHYRDIDIQTMLDPVSYLLSAGGKRWRSLFMLLATQAWAESRVNQAYQLVPLVEIVHHGSLIIDDIEDKAEKRRHLQATHLVFGTDVSINAGNLAYFAPSVVIDGTEGLSMQQRYACYQVWATALRQLHVGQGLDIAWHRQHDYWPSIDEYHTMCTLKTGCLSSMALQLSSIITQQEPSIQQEIGQLGQSLGVVFQMIDDVKNLTSGVLGKTLGDDIIEGKKSYPLLLAVQDQPHLVATFEQCYQQATSSDIAVQQQAIQQVIDVVHHHGYIQQARQHIAQRLTMLEQRLATLLPQHDATQAMISMIQQWGANV